MEQASDVVELVLPHEVDNPKQCLSVSGRRCLVRIRTFSLLSDSDGGTGCIKERSDPQRL